MKFHALPSLHFVPAVGQSTAADLFAVYPDMSLRDMEVGVDYINKRIGVQLEADTIAKLLSKMQLQGSVVAGGQSVAVKARRPSSRLPCVL